MAIRVTCPACATSVSVRDEAAGKSVRCQVCQGSIRVPGVVTDSNGEFGVPQKASKSPKKTRSTRAGTPLGVVFAMACVGVLMLLNLWLLTGEDEPVWKLIAVVRLFVEARVIGGLKERQNQTALTSTVAAAMMTLVCSYMMYILLTDPDVQLETTAKELFATKVYFIVQTLAEIGVIVGINLPGSRAHLTQ